MLRTVPSWSNTPLFINEALNPMDPDLRQEDGGGLFIQVNGS